jgi:diaminohydroxyphosphoribosylaminopyrimidine deaminase / 5-amino-6-(5-phosphoribosylamino)uracil reductase
LLNQPFRKHARTGRPLVVFKSAMSLDGHVATQTGDSKWISGEQSRSLVHGWRAEFDTVCIGIGTALADDPLLTARAPGALRQPTRIVFDSEARLPTDSQLVRTAPEVPLLVVVTRAAQRSRLEGLKAAGVEVIVAAGGTEAERVTDALGKLGAMGVQSVLLEGGPRLAGSFLDSGEVDEMRIFIAPIALGGRGARMSIEGEGADTIEHAQHAVSMGMDTVGEDVLIEARLREW